MSLAFAQTDDSSNETELDELQQANLAFTYEYPTSVDESFNNLFALVEEQGTARVIVTLDVPVNLEGAMSSDDISNPREAISAAQNNLFESLDAVMDADETRYSFKHVPYVVTTVNSEALNTLQASPMVANIVRDVPYPPLLFQSTDLIEADMAWNPNQTGGAYTGDGWQVAILDTGIDKNHSFLSGKVISEACYSSTVTAHSSQSLCPNGVPESILPDSGMPCVGIRGCDHGTHVAGIATGDTFQYVGNTYRGVAPDAEIIAINVFSSFNNSNDCLFGTSCILSYTSDQMKGLERVIDLAQDPTFSIASVNMSLGGGKFTSACDNDVRKPLIDQLKSLNVATVVASGNDGFTNAISTPACISSAISVGSTTKTDDVSSFSNSSPMLDLLAPGGGIISSLPNNGFAAKSGTSMAAPHVAGAWTLLNEKAEKTQPSPPLFVDDALTTLQVSGIPITDTRNGITDSRINLDDSVVFTVPEFPLAFLVLAIALIGSVFVFRNSRKFNKTMFLNNS